MPTRNVLALPVHIAALLVLTLALPAHAARPPVGTYYHHTDHLGSTVALSDSRGKVVERFDYTAYGTPRVRSNGAEAHAAARFTGKELDPVAGLMYFRAR